MPFVTDPTTGKRVWQADTFTGVRPDLRASVGRYPMDYGQSEVDTMPSVDESLAAVGRQADDATRAMLARRGIVNRAAQDVVINTSRIALGEPELGAQPEGQGPRSSVTFPAPNVSPGAEVTMSPGEAIRRTAPRQSSRFGMADVLERWGPLTEPAQPPSETPDRLLRARLASVTHDSGFGEATTNSVMRVAKNPERATVEDINMTQQWLDDFEPHTAQQRDLERQVVQSYTQARQTISRATEALSLAVQAANPQTMEQFDEALKSASDIPGYAQALGEFLNDPKNVPEVIRDNASMAERQRTAEKARMDSVVRAQLAAQNYTPEMIDSIIESADKDKTSRKLYDRALGASVTAKQEKEGSKKAKAEKGVLIGKIDFSNEDMVTILEANGFNQYETKIAKTDLGEDVGTEGVIFSRRAASVSQGANFLAERMSQNPDSDPMELARAIVSEQEESDDATVSGNEEAGREHLAQQIVKEAQRRVNERAKDVTRQLNEQRQATYEALDERVKSLTEYDQNNAAQIGLLQKHVQEAQRLNPDISLGQIAEDMVADELNPDSLPDDQARVVKEALEEWTAGSIQDAEARNNPMLRRVFDALDDRFAAVNRAAGILSEERSLQLTQDIAANEMRAETAVTKLVASGVIPKENAETAAHDIAKYSMGFVARDASGNMVPSVVLSQDARQLYELASTMPDDPVMQNVMTAMDQAANRNGGIYSMDGLSSLGQEQMNKVGVWLSKAQETNFANMRDPSIVSEIDDAAAKRSLRDWWRSAPTLNGNIVPSTQAASSGSIDAYAATTGMDAKKADAIRLVAEAMAGATDLVVSVSDNGVSTRKEISPDQFEKLLGDVDDDLADILVRRFRRDDLLRYAVGSGNRRLAHIAVLKAIDQEIDSATQVIAREQANPANFREAQLRMSGLDIPGLSVSANVGSRGEFVGWDIDMDVDAIVARGDELASMTGQLSSPKEQYYSDIVDALRELQQIESASQRDAIDTLETIGVANGSGLSKAEDAWKELRSRIPLDAAPTTFDTLGTSSLEDAEIY